MDNPELLDTAEDALDQWVETFHLEGLNYWQLMRLAHDIEGKLCTMADSEYWRNVLRR